MNVRFIHEYGNLMSPTFADDGILLIELGIIDSYLAGK